MRLLHTSDWHLGRTLHGEDLHPAQEQVLAEVIRVVDEHGVDAVVVAGDVYDRAVPPVASVQLLARVLDELSRRVPVVVVSGNHDSAARLGFGAGLYRDGLHVRTGVDQVGEPVELADEHGPVLVYPVPFLDPDSVRHVLAVGDEPLDRSHEAVLGEAMRRVRDDLRDRRSAGPGSVRSVVVSHAFVVGGEVAVTSDSERDIRVGGTDSVPSATFAGVDYVALGHLHGRQQPSSPDAGTVLRYCGSPLRYSFSESDQQKSVTLVDLGREGVASVQEVAVSQPRGMSRLADTMDQLLESPRYRSSEDDWVQVTVTDAARPTEMVPRIRERFPRALVVRHEPATGPLASGLASPGDVTTTDPRVVAETFVRTVTGADATDAELAAFVDAYERALADGRPA